MNVIEFMMKGTSLASTSSLPSSNLYQPPDSRVTCTYLLTTGKEASAWCIFLPKQASPRSEKATRKRHPGTRPQPASPRTIMSFYPASSEEEGQKYYQASSVSSSEKEGLDYVSPLSLPSLEVGLCQVE